MNPGLLLAAVATLGWGDADFRQPNHLLAAAFVARLSIDAATIEVSSPEAVALEIWYPPVPATRVLDVAGPSGVDARRDVRYTLNLPWFRTKP